MCLDLHTFVTSLFVGDAIPRHRFAAQQETAASDAAYIEPYCQADQVTDRVICSLYIVFLEYESRLQTKLHRGGYRRF